MNKKINISPYITIYSRCTYELLKDRFRLNSNIGGVGRQKPSNKQRWMVFERKPISIIDHAIKNGANFGHTGTPQQTI